MRPILTAVVAAIEALAVAIAGIAAVAIPALLLWTVTFGMSAEPGEVATNAAAVWLLGHFVPLTFSLTQEAAVSLGLAASPLRFSLTLVPLGITLVTVLLAIRSGWRFGGRGGTGAAGVIGGAAGFAAVTSLVVPLASGRIGWPSWSAILVPALVYGCASAAAFLVRAARDEHNWWVAILRWKTRLLTQAGLPGAAALPARLAEVVRLAAALLAALLGLAGVGLAAAIIAGYVSISTLTQNLQLDGLGALLLFLLQLAFLPTMLIWGVAWLSGAGFAVGAGSSASPFGALLGPMPALPMFGAIPQGWGGAGIIAPLMLALVGLGIGVLFANRAEMRRASWTVALAVTVAAAVVVGLAVVALAAFATGSIGPDRLATAGPVPWVVGGLVAAELGAGALAGVVARKIDYSRLRGVLPDFSDEVTAYPVRADSEYETGDPGGEVIPLPRRTAKTSSQYDEARESGTDDPDPDATQPYSFDTHAIESREPELFDQAEHGADPEPTEEQSETVDDLETEELLRAYSWELAHKKDVEEKNKGWHWPGKER